MTIKLDDIDLHQDLEWVDEFDWTPVQQKSERSLTGKLLIEEAEKIQGRPITLVGGENAAWHKRSVIKQLREKLVAGVAMTLQHNGNSYQVLWRHNETPIEAKPVVRISNLTDNDVYSLTLRFIEVENDN